MNKHDLVEQISSQTGFTKKDTDTLITATFNAIAEALVEGEKVTLVDFGTFEVRTRQPRTGRNINTGEKVRIPAMRVPTFRPGKGLKEKVAGRSETK